MRDRECRKSSNSLLSGRLMSCREKRPSCTSSMGSVAVRDSEEEIGQRHELRLRIDEGHALVEGKFKKESKKVRIGGRECASMRRMSG